MRILADTDILTAILTFNRADFVRYPGIIVLTPDMVLAEGFTLRSIHEES